MKAFSKQVQTEKEKSRTKAKKDHISDITKIRKQRQNSGFSGMPIFTAHTMETVTYSSLPDEVSSDLAPRAHVHVCHAAGNISSFLSGAVRARLALLVSMLLGSAFLFFWWHCSSCYITTASLCVPIFTEPKAKSQAEACKCKRGTHAASSSVCQLNAA